MAHADDATKAWVSATPTVNADDNVSRWNLKYKYTLAVSGSDDYVHTFDSTIRIATPSKAKTAYTQADYWLLMTAANKLAHIGLTCSQKYAYHISDKQQLLNTRR